MEKWIRKASGFAPLWEALIDWCREVKVPEELLCRDHLEPLINYFFDHPSSSKLIARIKTVRKLHSGPLRKPLIAPETPETSLTLFDKGFLREVFQKGAETITRVIDLLNTSSLSTEMEKKLKVWLFHYLFRNAKIPLFEQKGPLHLSPLEYQRSNRNEYYRMNGGAIAFPLLKFVREKYSFPEGNYFFALIKPNHFSFLTNVIFEGESFYDISSELNEAFPEKLEEVIETLKEKDPNGIFGGELKIGQQTFYLLFSKRNISSYEESLKQMQSGIGAIPDPSYLAHFLIDEKFPLSCLYDLSPIPLKAMRRKSIQPLPLSHPQTAIGQFYLSFFKAYWTHMKDCIHIRNMIEIDQVPILPLKRKVQEIFQEISLAIEELRLSFILSSTKPPPFQKILHQIAPLSSSKKTLLCTSGMSGYFHVFKSLKNLYGYKPKTAFLNTTYYEILFKPLMGSTVDLLCEPEINLTIEDFLQSETNWDVLCMDLYPNFVSIDPIHIPPIEKILRLHLKNRTSPLTLVLDITATIIQDNKLEKLVQTFHQEIKEEKLHLIYISSLAKFYTGGFDKYSGGFVQTYSAHPFKDLETSLENDPLSQEANSFFSMVFQKKGEWLTSYFRTIQQNADTMYHLLLPLQTKENPFYLCRKDEEIPFIGLSFKRLGLALIQKPLTNHHLNNIAYFLQFFLISKALTRDLPISVRDSFGFPLTNIRECGGALRITVGLEEPSLLKEIAHWLIEENYAIQKELPSLSEGSLKEIEYLLDINVRFFINWMEKIKLILIDYAKGHTLFETLHYLYKNIDPEKIFQIILSPLSEEEKEWTTHWKEVLIQMVQESFFTKQNLENFIHENVLPLKPLLEKIYTDSESRSFKALIKTEKKRWLDYLLSHSLDHLETYINNVYHIHQFHAHLFLTERPSAKWLNAFKEKALSYAEDHTPDQLKKFLTSYKKDPSYKLESFI